MPETPPPAPPFPPPGWRPARAPRAAWRRFPVTFGLGALILAWYVAELALGGAGDITVLTRLGCVRRDLVFAQGEAWRLLSAAFLHAGLIHLVLNGLAYIQLALLCELIYGSWRLLACYLLSALGGTLLSASFMPLPSVGASGAILGLAGLLLGTSWFGRDEARLELRRILGNRLLGGVALTFALGIALHVLWVPIVDNPGHLGGLLTGLAFSLVVRRPGQAPGAAVRALGAALLAALLVSLTLAAARGGRAAVGVVDDIHRLQLEMIEESASSSLARNLAPELSLYAMQAGLDEQGTRVLIRWLRAAPEDPEAVNAFAWHLLTRPEPGLRVPQAALCLARGAVARAEAAQRDAWWGDLRAALAAYLDTEAVAWRGVGRVTEAERCEARVNRLWEALLAEGQLGFLPALVESLARGRDPRAWARALQTWSRHAPDDPEAALAWCAFLDACAGPIAAGQQVVLTGPGLRALTAAGAESTLPGRRLLARLLEARSRACRWLGASPAAARAARRGLALLAPGQDPELRHRLTRALDAAGAPPR